MKSIQREPRPETIGKVFRLIKQSGKPISRGFVSHTLQVDWHSLRVILDRLCDEKKIEKIETNMADFFVLAKNDGGKK